MQPILLDDDFDGNELMRRPGLYTAISGTPAYPSLAAMAVGGVVELVGEHYDLDGNRVITVQVSGRGASRDVRQNPRMGIDPRFLQEPLVTYTDWKEAWWREAIQNAMDAGADRIELEAVEQPDGTYLVSCTDNGTGMSEEVLMEKFLYLGGTSKRNPGNPAGGFGTAKKLLLLPWMYWDIETQDTQMHGVGMDWEEAYPKKIAMRRGTRLAVQMPADNHTHAALAQSYVSKCHLPGVNITVNGERVYAKLRGGKVIREIEGHRVYHIPGSMQYSSMLIRIVGEKFDGALYTYSRRLPSGVKGMVLVDLVGSSVDLLTENRDEIRPWQLRVKLEDFASELSVDTKSALKSKASLIRKKYKGEGKFKADIQPQEIAARMVDAAGNAPQTGGELTSEKVESVLAVLADMLQAAQARAGVSSEEFGGIGIETAGIILANPLKGPAHLENTLKQLAWNPDFYLVNDIEGFKVPAKFTPEKMTPTVIKLLKTWTEFCRFVLAQLNCGTPFGVGFLFSADWGAMCIKEEDENWLVINPIYRKNIGEEDQLNPENTEHLNTMYELAIHEATHMADGEYIHNEDFTSALTYNNAICAPGWRKIRKIASSIKLARVKAEERPTRGHGLKHWTSEDLERAFQKAYAEFRADRLRQLERLQLNLDYPERDWYMGIVVVMSVDDPLMTAAPGDRVSFGNEIGIWTQNADSSQSYSGYKLAVVMGDKVAKRTLVNRTIVKDAVYLGDVEV